jgi:hypothetical protein
VFSLLSWLDRLPVGRQLAEELDGLDDDEDDERREDEEFDADDRVGGGEGLGVVEVRARTRHLGAGLL